MAQGFYTRVDTPAGPVLVHVNRRGCKGKWTAADDEELKRIITDAVQAIAGAPTSETPDVHYRDCTTCDGCGWLYIDLSAQKNPCARCYGTGRIRAEA